MEYQLRTELKNFFKHSALSPKELDGIESLCEDQLFHYVWTQKNQSQPPETALESPLLALHKTSDVNDLTPEQILDARQVLLLRRDMVHALARLQRLASPSGAGPNIVDPPDPVLRRVLETKNDILMLQKQIVERFLAGRRDYFGADQCRPFDHVEDLVQEGRDIFIIIKFMDEAPHIRATLQSLINQKHVDLRRVVIVAVDNNSTDGSDQIVKEVAAANRSNARIIYTNQPTPGGGSAARFGVDRSIATLYHMCLHDARWERLQTGLIAVSDGDTVYHPHVLRELVGIFDHDPTVDGVMPFLVYKYTGALRLFSTYIPSFPEELCPHAHLERAIPVPLDLSDTHVHTLLPRWGRKLVNDECMELDIGGETTVAIPLTNTDSMGRKFGVLRDWNGNIAYLLQDRTLVLAEAPVSGFDAALIFLENGGVTSDEKWRWHTLIGHDLFLYWAFAGMRLPEAMIYPDTSDALKMFRVWSFAIGGQHQLSRPDLPIVTGTDYQSGRILQAIGCIIRFGPAQAYAETEIDRLIKMIRNFAQQQSIFYGETRSSAIERASGLYLHMTRVQKLVEAEVREYSDAFFRDMAFPERILFPLRWVLQNAVRFYAHEEPAAQAIVRERVLKVIFTGEVAEQIERHWLHEDNIRAIRECAYAHVQTRAEAIAEGIIGDYYPHIMLFYQNTLRSFFAAHNVESGCYDWLLEGLEHSRNAIAEDRPSVHPSVVWQGEEFVIDPRRGQVVGMHQHG